MLRAILRFSKGSGSLPCGPIWTKLGVKGEDHCPITWSDPGHSVTKYMVTAGQESQRPLLFLMDFGSKMAKVIKIIKTLIPHNS